MKPPYSYIFKSSIVLLCTSLPFYAHAIIKCKDAEGNWHMGDTLPQECVEGGHQELNEQGFVIDEVAREKTDEEIAQEREQARLEEEQKAADEEQARKDKILLDTFSSVDDINSAREGKLAAIDAAIGLAEKRSEKFEKELKQMEKKAAEQDRAGHPPSEKTIAEIESLRRQLENNNNFIAEKKKETGLVNAAYDKDVARFNELESSR